MNENDIKYKQLEHDYDELLKELSRLKKLNRELIKTAKSLLVYCHEGDKKLIYREKIAKAEGSVKGNDDL